MWEFSNTPANEPGTYRYSYLSTNRTWPSVEEQVKEAQKENLKNHSSYYHELKPAYFRDCDHIDPDGDPKYEDIDDLTDEWLAKNCLFDGTEKRAPIKSPEWDIYYKNWIRAQKAIPLVAEFGREKDHYDDNHNYDLCLLSPAGVFCGGCQENDWEDSAFGVEVGGCWRQETARDEHTDFWSLFSEDNLDRLRA